MSICVTKNLQKKGIYTYPNYHLVYNHYLYKLGLIYI
jgi:hypothetical protein